MNIAKNIERGSNLFPNKPALIFEGKYFTYKHLNEIVNRAANALKELGIKRGERVALFLPNIPEFIISYLGIQKIGAIAVSINVSLQEDEVKFILDDDKGGIDKKELLAFLMILVEKFHSDVQFRFFLYEFRASLEQYKKKISPS